MNRWRQRLAQLHGDDAEQPRAVQNVQNIQNPARGATFEHFEQIEQPREQPPALSTPPAAEEKRAAAVKRKRNIPREWAEGVARLDPDVPPGDVPPGRWQCFVDDVGLFLDSPFCAVAAALGWGPFDLFGCDGDRPFARIDQAGLLWLLNGDRLVILAESTATIERRTGARHAWRRKHWAPGRVLAWELSRRQALDPPPPPVGK